MMEWEVQQLKEAGGDLWDLLLRSLSALLGNH
jgi:hypothetical protein